MGRAWAQRFTPPPSWPELPSRDWRPPPGWEPEPEWGPAPYGWEFWTDQPPRRAPRVIGIALVLALAGLALLARQELGRAPEAVRVAAADPTTAPGAAPLPALPNLPDLPTGLPPTPDGTPSEPFLTPTGAVPTTVTARPSARTRTTTPRATRGPADRTAAPRPRRTTPAPTTGADPGPDELLPDFADCDAARAHGLDLPIPAGAPGYAPHLDEDGDGWACEG